MTVRVCGESAASAVLASLALAACTGASWTPVDVGLTKKLQLVGERAVVTGVTTGLIGVHESVYGIDSALLGVRSKRGAGVSLAGYWVGSGDYDGLQIGFATHTERINGVLIGAANNAMVFLETMDETGDVERLWVNGLQLGVGSYTEGVRGLQVSALFNAARAVDGVQFAPLNFAVRRLDGVQAGFVNSACGGMQLGLYNYSSNDLYQPADPERDGSAFQAGLVNVAKGGFQIGLLNFNRNGFLPVFPLVNF